MPIWYKFISDGSEESDRLRELLLVFGIDFWETTGNKAEVFREEELIGGLASVEKHLRKLKLDEEKDYRRSKGQLSPGEAGTSKEIKF